MFKCLQVHIYVLFICVFTNAYGSQEQLIVSFLRRCLPVCFVLFFLYSLTQDIVILILGIYLKDAQSYHKDTCSTMFIAVLFVMART